MKVRKRKRGRPPLGRKAMTPAERQARRRQKLRQLAGLPAYPGATLPHPGYREAKRKMIDEGHVFIRTRREWGDEFGVFVDGALMDSSDVVRLAAEAKWQRELSLAARRKVWKDSACQAVANYHCRPNIGWGTSDNVLNEKIKRGF
jgi:hypothetical protein